MAEPPEPRPGFSEREFYLREFRGRTLAIVVSRAEFAAPVLPALDELAAGGARVLLIAREARTLELLAASPMLRASDPRLEGNVWRALHASVRVGIVVARAEDFGDHARELACKLGVFKLVWLDPDGGLRTRSGERLAFVHREELAELLGEPRRLSGAQRLRLWREVADMLDAGLPAINVCAPEGLADELFSYAGSGTLFTRERYVSVRPLGVDDFDAAHDLLRRGVEEGYLAPRDEEEVDALLAAGFGAFVEGRDLAGIGSLLPSLDGRGAEIAGLYTLTRYLGEGVGFSLVAHALGEARERGLAYVFACTTSERVGAFFERNGLRPVGGDELPAAKWNAYDPERRVRVRCYRRELAGEARRAPAGTPEREAEGEGAAEPSLTFAQAGVIGWGAFWRKAPMTRLSIVCLFAVLFAGAAAVAQEDVAPGVPSFKEGDIISMDQVEKLKPFLPDEFWTNRDFFFYEGMQLEIGPSFKDYSPNSLYVEATKKFAGQPKVGPESSLENFTMGQPFPIDQIDCKGDPQAGAKIAWDFFLRFEGLRRAASFYYSYWDRGEELPLYYEGTSDGYRLSFRTEPQFAEQKGDVFRNEKRYEASGPSVDAPFDARGIMLMTYRYKASLGPKATTKNDDTWVYVPTLRRVRRISTAQRTDAVSGTDFTFDDLFSFNGVVPQYEWQCLGRMDLIAPTNTKVKAYPYQRDHNFGPYGLSFADDRWDLRHAVKIRFTPSNSDHPYSFKDIYIDTNSMEPMYSFAYDRKKELWKIIWHNKRWSDAEDYPEYNPYEGMPEPRDLTVVSDIIVNVQTGTGNRIEFWDRTGTPEGNVGKIRRVIDVGRLTKGR